MDSTIEPNPQAESSSGSSTTPHVKHEENNDKNNSNEHHHHLHIGLHHDHPHEPENHHGHFHPHVPNHRHTVIHAVKSKHPPHHNSQVKTRKYLIAKPRARQYFTDNGDLHKQCDDGVPRQAGKFELFLDLLYIGLTANFAEDMVHHPTSPAHLGKYILIFIPAWRIWSDLTSLMNVYYNDDIIQRILIVWIMIIMLLYGNNATFIDESLSAIRVTVGSFLAARVSLICINFLYSLTVHQHALQLRYHSFLSLATIPIWTPVFLSPAHISNHSKIVVAIVAFFADEAVSVITHNTWFKRHFKIKYSTAVDIDHHIERMSAFYIIVLGEFLYGLVWASPAGLDNIDSKFGRAAMSLIIAFCLCWLYVSCDGSRENPESGIHALRWKVINAFQWILLHLPLSASLLIAGDICAVFVKYGDDLAGIEENLTKRAEDTFPAKEDWQGLRWLFCGGLAIGLLCLYWISLLHHEVDEDEDTKCIMFFRAWLRRVWRAPFAIIIACLPLAPPEKLTITGLLAICTVLLLFTLIWEMLGGMDASWDYVEGGKDKFCDSEEIAVSSAKGDEETAISASEK